MNEKEKLIKQLEDGIALERHVTEALESLAKDVDEATRIRLNYILIFHSENVRYFEAVKNLLKGDY